MSRRRKNAEWFGRHGMEPSWAADDYVVRFMCPRHGVLGYVYRPAIDASNPPAAYTPEEWRAIVERNRRTIIDGHGIEVIEDSDGIPRKVAGRCTSCRNLDLKSDPQVSIARVFALLDDAERTSATGVQELALA